MPRYRVKETTFVNNRLAQPGEIVEYNHPTKPGADGKAPKPVGSSLELIREKKAPQADENKGGDTTSDVTA